MIRTSRDHPHSGLEMPGLILSSSPLNPTSASSLPLLVESIVAVSLSMFMITSLSSPNSQFLFFFFNSVLSSKKKKKKDCEFDF
ncbi:hypothetical protein ACSBR2_036025 [Camellia fascicularis]